MASYVNRKTYGLDRSSRHPWPNDLAAEHICDCRPVRWRYSRWLSGVQKPCHLDSPAKFKSAELLMRAIVHPFLTLLASSKRQDLAAQNRLLKAENQILRSKLPNRITLSNQERAQIVKHGKPLGGKIKNLLTIVSYSSFRRWVRQMEDGQSPDGSTKKKKKSLPGGRPKTDESIRDCVIRIRKETGWGYTRIPCGQKTQPSTKHCIKATFKRLTGMHISRTDMLSSAVIVLRSF